jgi:glycerol-1-phosphatase
MSSAASEAAFTAPMESHSFTGILLDLDGTIIDSTDAIIKHWYKSGSF